MRDERRKEAIDRRKTERQKAADLASYLADSVVESANGRSSGHGLTISPKGMHSRCSREVEVLDQYVSCLTDCVADVWAQR